MVCICHAIHWDQWSVEVWRWRLNFCCHLSMWKGIEMTWNDQIFASYLEHSVDTCKSKVLVLSFWSFFGHGSTSPCPWPTFLLSVVQSATTNQQQETVTSCTLPETNIVPKFGGWKMISFWDGPFWGSMLVSGRVIFTAILPAPQKKSNTHCRGAGVKGEYSANVGLYTQVGGFRSF